MLDADTATILVVDDLTENLLVLDTLLRPRYQVLAATSGEKALRLAAAEPRPDLILLDVMMPGMDGFQVFEHLRAEPATHAIPVIFVTAMDGVEAELRGLDLGAVDYITKPIVAAVVLARVRTQLELKHARDRLKDHNHWLEREVAKRLAENEIVQEVSIRALAHLAEARDPETGNHILRTQGYVLVLAQRLQQHPRYGASLNDRYLQLLVRSAPLHDIGKVGIPDTILQKPGPLTPQEWEVMKTHARIGREAIDRAERDSQQPVQFLTLAKEIAHWHHEKWDGSGYPQALAGEAIPQSGRIVAVADVFDALTSARPYKKAWTVEAAEAYVRDNAGSHFDPAVAACFLDNLPEILAIRDRHQEPEE
jgi:putative two-component system response regulator